jgi:hypothetical protein
VRPERAGIVVVAGAVVVVESEPAVVTGVVEVVLGSGRLVVEI